MVFHWVSTFIPIRLLVTPQQGHKVVQYHKKLNISHDLSCIELKLATVLTLITKFHYMSPVIFPWQHNGLQAFSIQRGKSEFSFFKKSYLLLFFICGSSDLGKRQFINCCLLKFFENPINTLRTKIKDSIKLHFKVDRQQIIVVAKNIIVLQLFTSRMPKMCAIPQLVSTPFNPVPIAEHFRRSHPH